MLVVDDQVLAQGAIGVSIAGEVSVDHVVSQGCRPIGTPLVVTKAKNNLLLELGGRPALEVVQETMNEMEHGERDLLEMGLLLGSAIDESKRPLEGVVAVEALNGGSRKGENERVEDLIEQHGYYGLGGSDSHLVSLIGVCATEFDSEVRDIDGLVDALRSGEYCPVDFRPRLAEARGNARG